MAEINKQRTATKTQLITDELIAQLRKNPNIQVQEDKNKISYIVKSFNGQGYYHHFKMVQFYDPTTRVATEPEPVVGFGKGEVYFRLPVSAKFCKELGEHLLKVADAMHGLEYIPPARGKETSEHDDMILDFIKKNNTSLGDLKESSA